MTNINNFETETGDSTNQGLIRALLKVFGLKNDLNYELSMKICENTSIEISYPIINKDAINYTTSDKLSKKDPTLIT